MAKLNRFSDLHCHSSFMSFLWRSKPRKTIRQKIISSAKNRFAISLTNSSSDIDKLIKGNVHLISASLYAIERGFTQLSVVRFFLFFVTKIDAEKLRLIRKNQFGYNDQIRRNIAYIKKALIVNPKVQFRLIHDASDFKEDDKVNVVLSIEGSHALFSNTDNDLNKTDELWRNLEFLKNESTVRIFYLTLVHIQKTPIANHAFGIPQKALRHKDFLPKGDGISRLGFELIENCLSNTNGKPIFIDIKHMSVKARLQYYSWRNVNAAHIPIIASHMGVVGKSISKNPVKTMVINKENIELEYFSVESELGVKFNNWSINLFDEEIVEIFKSGGIIGLSLDVGILGLNGSQKEIFSLGEKLFIKENFLIGKEEASIPNFSQEVHDIDYFINNLFHLFKIAEQYKLKGVHNQICIGSDFDGLIAPIMECQNATMFSNFSLKLEKRLLDLKRKYPKTLDFDVEEFTEKLFYSNFKNFVIKYI